MIYYNYPSYYFPSNINMQNRNFKTATNTNLNILNNRKNDQKPFQKPVQNPIQTHLQKPISDNDDKEFKNLKDENPLFEILGIKLYSDDILLLCLIFFLYTEGVQDQYLFIALILLLLS